MKKYSIQKSEALYDKLKEYLPGGVASSFHTPQYRPYPTAIAYGKGSKLYDVDGNEYIDYDDRYDDGYDGTDGYLDRRRWNRIGAAAGNQGERLYHHRNFQ